MTATPAAPASSTQAPYQARPGRGVLVAGDLADLRGPVAGTVELPLWLFWYPDRAFDLDDPATLRWMYQIVLREASRPEDLTSFLNGDMLVALWPGLFLPRAVRQAWEERYPVLLAMRPADAGHRPRRATRPRLGPAQPRCREHRQLAFSQRSHHIK